MSTIRRLQPEGRLSGAVVHGNTVSLAGQVAEDTSLDAEAETADIRRQIDARLADPRWFVEIMGIAAAP